MQIFIQVFQISNKCLPCNIFKIQIFSFFKKLIIEFIFWSSELPSFFVLWTYVCHLMPWLLYSKMERMIRKKWNFWKNQEFPRLGPFTKKSTLGLQKNMGLRLGPIRAQVGPRPGLITRNKHEYQISWLDTLTV